MSLPSVVAHVLWRQAARLGVANAVISKATSCMPAAQSPMGGVKMVCTAPSRLQHLSHVDRFVDQPLPCTDSCLAHEGAGALTDMSASGSVCHTVSVHL